MLRYGTAAPRRFLSAALLVRLAAWLIGLTAAGFGFSPPTEAASEAPPALLDWLRAGTARAKAADESDRTSGVPALNGNLSRSFRSLRTSGPEWLDRVDVGVDLQQDLSAAYRVGAMQPLLKSQRGDATVEGRTWLAYDAIGNRSGSVGIGYRSEVQDERFAADVYTRAEENRLGRLWRYVFGGSVGWAALQLHAHLINKVAEETPAGKRRFQEPVDSYRIEVRSEVPALPWARVGAARFWDGAPTVAGNDTEGYSLRLWMQPFQPVVLETGADDNNWREPDWFACLRLQMKLH